MVCKGGAPTRFQRSYSVASGGQVEKERYGVDIFPLQSRPSKLLLCSFQAIAFINLQQVFGKGPLRISSSAETHRELTVPLNPSAHTRSCFRDTPANPLARLSMTTAHLQCPKW